MFFLALLGVLCSVCLPVPLGVLTPLLPDGPLLVRTPQSVFRNPLPQSNIQESPRPGASSYILRVVNSKESCRFKTQARQG